MKLAREHGRIACVTVIPGYDDTKIRKPGLKADRLDGQVYRVLWDKAIKAKPDWVLITSWNEWHEGSEIEPSLETATNTCNSPAIMPRASAAAETSGLFPFSLCAHGVLAV